MVTHTRDVVLVPTVERTDLDETTLVARAQDGDLSSFERLVDSYSGPLFRLALRIVADRGDAEDVVQETMVTVWRRLPQLVDGIAFPRWIHQIATRLALNVLRTRRRRPADSTEPDRFDDRPGPGQPEAIAEGRAVVDALEREVAALPDAQRVCWVLSAYERRTYTEIAELTQTTEATVRGRIARARRRLAESMSEWR